MRPLVLCVLVGVLNGCAWIPGMTSKGWVKEQISMAIKDTVNPEIARVQATVPKDIPPGTIVAWIPSPDAWEKGELKPPEGWALVQDKFQYPKTFDWAYLKGLVAIPDNQAKIGKFDGRPAHSHSDTVSAPMADPNGSDKPSGQYVIAQAGGHTHEITLSQEPNEPPHLGVVFIYKLEPEKPKE